MTTTVGFIYSGIVRILRNHHSYIIRQAQHGPPHIHALYGEDMAAVDIETGEVPESHLPPEVLAMAREWTAIHKNDLLHMWETQELKSLSPLE